MEPSMEEFSPEEIERMLRHAHLLGSGSFGKVFSTTHAGSSVAVKILKKSDRLAELKQEIEYSRARPHPNVIQFMGACTKSIKPGGNTLVLVMELMDTDMERLLADSSVFLSLYTRMKMAYEAALGLAWLHGGFSRAILHRDFATKNLFVKKKGDGWIVKVADFGLARSLEGNTLTRNHGEDKKRPPGTPLTQAPEVMKNHLFGTSADVYSFGMVLWEILTRRPLFEGWEEWCSYDDFVERVTSGYRHTIPKEAPRRVRKLIEACWQDDADQRPTMQAVVSELEHILVEVAIGDPEGQAFWKSRLWGGSDTSRFRELVDWTQFVTVLYRHVHLSMPADEASPSESPNVGGYVWPTVSVSTDIKKLDGSNAGAAAANAVATSTSSASTAPPSSASSAASSATSGGQTVLGPGSSVRRSQDSSKRLSAILGKDELATGALISTPSSPSRTAVARRGLSAAVLNYRCLKRILSSDRPHSAGERQMVHIEQFGELLEWFGPMYRLASGDESSDVVTFLDRIRHTLGHSWFHGPVDAQTAAHMVSGGEVGTFLVRYSHQPGAFTIVVNAGDAGAKHIRIVRKLNGKFAVSEETEFISLEEIVECVGPALDPPLTVPAAGSRYISLFQA